MCRVFGMLLDPNSLHCLKLNTARALDSHIPIVSPNSVLLMDEIISGLRVVSGQLS